ncbi:MAG: hypothetical protein ACLROH_04365 [Streptococcus sp.]
MSYTNKDGYGLTADQIVETYGLASSVEYDKNSLTLSWDRAKNASHQNVYFRFEKVDGNYYLKTVEAFDLEEFYADEEDDEDTSADRELSTKEFKNLKTGDKKTGEGGTSLSEVLKKHNKSSVIRIGTETKKNEDGEKYGSTRVIATVNFKVGDDYKTLRFLAQPDGDFLYIGPERY